MKKDIEKEIASILRINDPLGLIAGGAPDDEYDLEVPGVLDILGASNSAEEVQKKIYDQFKEGLGNMVGDIKHFSTTAIQLYELVRTNKLNDNSK